MTPILDHLGNMTNGGDEENRGNLDIGIIAKGNRVVIQFPQSIRWFGLTRNQALEFVRMIKEQAKKLP